METVSTMKRENISEHGDEEVQVVEFIVGDEKFAVNLFDVKEIVEAQYQCLHKEIFPALSQAGILFLSPSECNVKQKEFLAQLFEREIFPILTPVRVPKGSPLPAIRNLRLFIVFLLQKNPDLEDGEEGEEEKFILICGYRPGR